MTDYTTPSGAGQLMIRDQGSSVEFWVYAGYNLQWNNLQFNVDANGTTTGFSINYHASQVWQQVGAITVSTSQTITFRLLTATGTSSLGGPTSMSVALNRGTVPAAPSTPTINTITTTSLNVNFSDGGNGGVAIDARQIGYGKSASGATSFISSDGSTAIGGLTKGTTYYFWAQTHNARGWGPWSGRAQATTLREPDAPIFKDITEITQTSVKYHFVGGANAGGTSILEWQIGYGTSSASPTTYISSGGLTTVPNLQPGTTYYFWAQGRNSVGWSPLSARTSAKTISGASVKVGLVWKDAVPYVRVGGVWKIARPWVNKAGVWKESQ